MARNEAVVPGRSSVESNPPASAASPRPAQATAKADSPAVIRQMVFRLAWPSILENLLQSVFNIIMVMMVAQLGPAAIAGVGASSGLIQVAMAGFFALSMGTTVMVAHATGAGNKEAANRTAKQSLVMGVILGLFITALGLAFAPAAIRMLGAESEVVTDGAAYLRAFSLGGVFIVTTFITGGVMRGSGDARTPMLVTLGTLIASLGLGYVAIFGKFGLPTLGIAGAGLATAGARGIGCLILVALLFRPGRDVSLRGQGSWRPQWTHFQQLMNIGLPSMFESLFRAGGMLMFAKIVFGLGTTVAAAQQIAQQIGFFSMMPGFGFSMASMALVGQSLGANSPARARSASWFAMRSCLVWMGSMGLVFFFGGPFIMRLFINDAEIIHHGANALKVIALAQPGQAIGMVLAGSLRGAGDTRYPMVTTATAMWLVRLPIAWLMGIVLGFGLSGVYSGWVADSLVNSCLNWLRYRAGKWQQKRVTIN